MTLTRTLVRLRWVRAVIDFRVARAPGGARIGAETRAEAA
jgi:hypothetical protein